MQVRYELKPGWHFVSKQIVLTLAEGETCRVQAVQVLQRDAAESDSPRASSEPTERRSLSPLGRKWSDAKMRSLPGAAESVSGLAATRARHDDVVRCRTCMERRRWAVRVRSSVHWRVCARPAASRPLMAWRSGSTCRSRTRRSSRLHVSTRRRFDGADPVRRSLPVVSSRAQCARACAVV